MAIGAENSLAAMAVIRWTASDGSVSSSSERSPSTTSPFSRDHVALGICGPRAPCDDDLAERRDELSADGRLARVTVRDRVEQLLPVARQVLRNPRVAREPSESGFDERSRICEAPGEALQQHERHHEVPAIPAHVVTVDSGIEQAHDPMMVEPRKHCEFALLAGRNEHAEVGDLDGNDTAEN